MTLEPLVVTAQTPPNDELRDMTRRLWIGAVLALRYLRWKWVVIFRAGLPPSRAASIASWVELCYRRRSFCGRLAFFERAWASLVNRSLNMFSLIALGTGSAYLYSVVATLAPGIFPRVSLHGRTVAVYFEAAAVITVWYSCQSWSCVHASRRAAPSARCSTSRLRRLVASRRTGMMKNLARAGPGRDRLRVRPGDGFPWTASFWRAPARSMSRW